MTFPAIRCWARSLLIAGLLSVGLAGTAAAERWKCYTFVPVATDPTYLALTQLAKDIGTATGGAIDMTCYVGGSLPIKSQTIVQAVSDGVIQYAMANPNALESFTPIAGILSLPGLFADDRELEKGIAVAAPYITQDLARKGVRLLAWSHFPQATVFSTGVVASVQDLQGKKIRVSTPEQSELLRRLGINPVVISSPEVSSALNTGVIEGVLTSNSGGGRAWKDLFKSTYRLGTNFTPFVFIAGAAAVDGLDPADREALAEKTTQAAAAITADLVTSDDRLTEEFAAGGMVVNLPAGDEATLVERTMRDYWDEWAAAKGPEAQEALAKIRAALGK